MDMVVRVSMSLLMRYMVLVLVMFMMLVVLVVFVPFLMMLMLVSTLHLIGVLFVGNFLNFRHVQPKRIHF